MILLVIKHSHTHTHTHTPSPFLTHCSLNEPEINFLSSSSFFFVLLFPTAKGKNNTTIKGYGFAFITYIPMFYIKYVKYSSQGKLKNIDNSLSL